MSEKICPPPVPTLGIDRLCDDLDGSFSTALAAFLESWLRARLPWDLLMTLPKDDCTKMMTRNSSHSLTAFLVYAVCIWTTFSSFMHLILFKYHILRYWKLKQPYCTFTISFDLLFSIACQRITEVVLTRVNYWKLFLKLLDNFYRAIHFSAKRGIAIACRLSVRLSVTLVNCYHIGWNSSKIISPSVSLACSLFATQTSRVYSKGNTTKFSPE